jgi:hypothetical protein
VLGFLICAIHVTNAQDSVSFNKTYLITIKNTLDTLKTTALSTDMNSLGKTDFSKQELDSLDNLIGEKKSAVDSATDNTQRMATVSQDKINQAITTSQSHADSLVHKISSTTRLKRSKIVYRKIYPAQAMEK